MMHCNRCSGRVFLDRAFSDNGTWEIYCLRCGGRRFITKGSALGLWLSQKEQRFQYATGGKK